MNYKNFIPRFVGFEDDTATHWKAPSTVETWFKDSGLTQIDVRLGSNGIVGNATKSMLKGKSD